jgi:hypothetical protein
VYTQVLQWGSDLQDWNTADVLLLADCVCYMEVSVLTIITVEYKIRKYTHTSSKACFCMYNQFYLAMKFYLIEYVNSQNNR